MKFKWVVVDGEDIIFYNSAMVPDITMKLKIECIIYLFIPLFPNKMKCFITFHAPMVNSEI